MAVLFWTLVFFSVLLTLTVSAPDRPSHCKHPAIRKEWRALSPRERTEWIAAVDVGGYSFFAITVT